MQCIRIYFDLNVNCQVCVFRADRKNKISALISEWHRHFQLLVCKTLNRIQRCFAGSKISMFFTKKQHGRLTWDWLIHFWLLLFNRWTEFNGTWQEARSERPLLSKCYWANQKRRWAPWPLICWDIFEFFLAIAEQKSTKLDRTYIMLVLNIWHTKVTTRGPKGHISCTWVQCATFLKNRPGQPSSFFSIGLKNTNLIEDVILLLVKFPWIPLSGLRGKVENVSANQRQGRPSCFSDRPEKHKPGRWHWDLRSYQVPLNPVQRFQRRSKMCLSLSESMAATLFFRSTRKTQTW